jgi:hypothetical protein
MHTRKEEESGVSMKRIDEISKACQGNTVVLAVEVLQSSVDLKNVGQGARSLYTQLLIWYSQLFVQSVCNTCQLTSDVQGAQGSIALQTPQCSIDANP